MTTPCGSPTIEAEADAIGQRVEDRQGRSGLDSGRPSDAMHQRAEREVEVRLGRGDDPGEPRLDRRASRLVVRHVRIVLPTAQFIRQPTRAITSGRGMLRNP